jgi:hypothetical protein
MVNHSYTAEQNDFLRSVEGTDTYKNIAIKFNEKFKTNITKEAIRRKMRRGFYVSHTPKYTPEQDAFIRTQSQIYTLAKVKAMFKDKYGLEITKQAITDRCRRVYHTAPVKAKDKVDYRQYWSELPIGDEAVKDGKVIVKTDNALGRKFGNWKYKHWHIWEQHNGPVPKGYRVIFLDGNNRNFDINNLACVPLKYICLLACNNWKFENAELTKAALKWCELFYKLKESSK